MILSLYNNDIKATIISSEGYDNDNYDKYILMQTNKKADTKQTKTKNKNKTKQNGNGRP